MDIKIVGLIRNAQTVAVVLAIREVKLLSKLYGSGRRKKLKLELW
jgi:hypothetical protein